MADARVQQGSISLTWTGATNPERQFNNFSLIPSRDKVEASRFGSLLKRELLGTWSVDLSHNCRPDDDGVFRKLLLQQMNAQTQVTVVFRASSASKSVANPEHTVKLFVAKCPPFGSAFGTLEEGSIDLTVHYYKYDDGTDIIEVT